VGPLDALREQGWALCPDVFAPSELAPWRAAFDRLEARAAPLDHTTDLDGGRFVIEATGAGGTPALQRVVWCGGPEPELLAAGHDPRILGLAADVLGRPDLEQLINQAHFKRPRDGVAFPFHQDAWNRRVGQSFDDLDGRGSYVQIVLCLDDMGLDNGPLGFLPATHRDGARWLNEPPEVRRAHVDELMRRQPPVWVEATAGSLVLFGPYVFHGSEPNRSQRPRRTLINGFATPGANRRRYPGAGRGLPVRLA
jgi:ectoine hydroxylase-related dioxygenase (phytanoyl-CoA dioxygenase family)